MRLTAILILALTWPFVTAHGQEDHEPTEFVDSYNDRFLDELPFLDSVLADVTAWDAEGKPFELNSTREKHTVIVFGCLT